MRNDGPDQSPAVYSIEHTYDHFLADPIFTCVTMIANDGWIKTIHSDYWNVKVEFFPYC